MTKTRPPILRRILPAGGLGEVHWVSRVFRRPSKTAEIKSARAVCGTVNLDKSGMQIGIAKPCEQHVRRKIDGEALASRNGLPKNLEAMSRDSPGGAQLWQYWKVNWSP